MTVGTDTVTNTDLLPWATPHLDLIGTMADVHADAGGDSDSDGHNQNAAS